MRVISLLAGATEIVCALDAGEMLVGRSHECDTPAWVRQLPQCSRPAFDISVSSSEIDAEVRGRLRAGEPLYHLDLELIRELQPDLVIAQSHCDVCAVTPADLARGECALAARHLALSAATVDEIFRGVLQVGTALGLRERAHVLVEQERRRLKSLQQRAGGFRRPSVVMLEWADPLFAMGNWGPELIEIANGEPLLGSAGEFSRAIPAERLLDADPEYLIVAPCGFNLERAEREFAVLASHTWWNRLRAVRSSQVAFADGNLFFNRSGMSIAASAEMLAEILHGIPAGAPTEGRHWRRMAHPSAAAVRESSQASRA